MLQKFFCAAVIVVIGSSVAVSEEFQAKISKVDGNNVTFVKIRKGGDRTEMTLPVTADAKITKGKLNKDTKKMEAGDSLEGGLKSDTFKKPVIANMTTDADNKNITAIRIDLFILMPDSGPFFSESR